VLDDLAVLQPEDVDDRGSALARDPDAVHVPHDEVAVREELLDVGS
jgi:hypothetical protein